MAGRRSLLEQRVVRARSGGSCAAKYVPTVIHYWRVSALVRGVYRTGSFESSLTGSSKTALIRLRVHCSAERKLQSFCGHVFENVLLLVSRSLNRKLVPLVLAEQMSQRRP